MVASTVLSVIVFVVFFHSSRSEETEEEALFQSWKVEHNRVYENKMEENKRFKIFKENLEDINMRNHQNKVLYGGKGAEFGLNQFSGIN